MRLERNTAPRPNQEKVSAIIASTIASFERQCAIQGVAVELDLDDCQVSAPTDFVTASAEGMIANALRSMPAGGELSITLIETEHQWELEVADSGPNPSRLSNPELTKPSNGQKSKVRQSDESLPHIVEFPSTEEIRQVIRVAIKHGSSVESFSCPLGGTAWIMAVPKFLSDSKVNLRSA